MGITPVGRDGRIRNGSNIPCPNIFAGYPGVGHDCLPKFCSENPIHR